MKVADLRHEADLLIDLAFNEKLGRPDDRVRMIGSQSLNLGPVIEQVWHSSVQDDNVYLADSVWAAAVEASVPSLEVVARSETHTIDTAQEVYEDFQGLAADILREGSPLERSVINQRAGKDALYETDVQLARIAVLGLLWWGHANRQHDETIYALPVSSTEYAALQMRPGNHNRFPAHLAVRKSGSGKKHYVHASSYISRTAERKMHGEHPGLVTIGIDTLTGNPGPINARHLLFLLQDNNYKSLSEIYTRASHRFSDAELRKQTARTHGKRNH